MQKTLYQLTKAEECLQRTPTDKVLIELKRDLEQLLELYRTQAEMTTMANDQEKLESDSQMAGGSQEGSPGKSRTVDPQFETVKKQGPGENGEDQIQTFYEWSIGETAMCKWTDGHFYEAVVLEINGNEYQVGFVGYDETELMHPTNMKPLMLEQKVKEASISKEVGEIKDEKKVKKPKMAKSGEKKIRKRDVEQNSKQQAWQSFLKKK
jgi:hypothetical protein